MNTLDDCTLTPLERHRAGRRGTLAVAPGPWPRVYFIYDVPGGEDRGEHAHRTLDQLIVAASGSFDVLLDDGSTRRTVHLSRPDVGLRVPAHIWHRLENFSSGAVALALASDIYKEEDYIRDYDEFLKFRNNG